MSDALTRAQVEEWLKNVAEDGVVDDAVLDHDAAQAKVRESEQLLDRIYEAAEQRAAEKTT